MIRLDFDNGESCMVPWHVFCYNMLASDKSRKSYDRWRRLFTVIGGKCYAKNMRSYRRMKHHEREHMRWNDRMQAIVPYLPQGAKWIKP
jgi:hypothetical protein